MDLLDLAIAIAVAGFAASGYRRGLSWVAISIASLAVGIVIAAAVAPPIARQVAHNQAVEPLVGAVVFLSVVMVVQGVGTILGYRARLWTITRSFAGWDSALGAGVAVVGALAAAWYLGLTFSQSPWTYLDREIEGSTIIRGLDSLAPRPPGFLAQLQQILRGEFPNPFASLGPSGLPPARIPPLLNTPGTRAAAAATAKVLSYGCGGTEAGSSWPMSVDYMVTNAHVVAGADRVVVETADGSSRDATVVLFDPDVDVAVLHVPAVGLAPLPVDDIAPARGTSGAVVGYPGGGSESVVSAAVRGTENARGYNIYGTNLVTRQIAVLATHVIPGNSGGPLVNQNGHVIGLVFAASTVNPTEGYALTVPQIRDDLNAGRGRTGPVSTQDCAR